MFASALLATITAISAASTPTINASALQDAIMASYRAGRPSHRIPSGTYRVTGGATNAFFVFSGLSNFLIDGTGVTLILTDPGKMGFRFGSSSNVTLRGITLRRDPAAFTQGTIDEIVDNGRTYVVTIHAGYPTDLEDRSRFREIMTGYVFDPRSRQWRPGSVDLFFNTVERLAANRFRMVLPERVVHSARPGDFIAFRGQVRTDLFFNNCEAMKVHDVTIRGAAGYAIHEHRGNGGNYYRFRLTYGSTPPGGRISPLMSANADGLHSSGVRRGPIVERSFMEGMADDGVSIHGNYAAVTESLGNQLIINCLWNELPFNVGDPLRLYNARGDQFGDAIVTAAIPLSDYTPPQTTNHFRFRRNNHFWRITLDRVVEMEFDQLVGSPATLGSDFTIRNNTFRNHRARAVMVKADRGLIEGNRIQGVTIAGIVVSPEVMNMESDFSRDIIIRNNHIRQTGFANVGNFTAQAGAISVTAHGKEGLGHERILIENNTIENVDGINLLVTNAQGVTIRRNRMINAMVRPNARGTNYRLDTDSLVFLQDVSGVTFDRNQITRPGRAMLRRLSKGPRATNVATDAIITLQTPGETYAMAEGIQP